MGSSSGLTMLLAGFSLFLLLALLGPIEARDNFISNSSRATTRQLSTMINNNANDINKQIYLALQLYAKDCCKNSEYGYDLGEECESQTDPKQMSFWVTYPKSLTDIFDIMEHLQENFYPASLPKDKAKKICQGTGNDNEPYPNFARILKSEVPPNGHTETQLIKPMQAAANAANNDVNFHLFTTNSPCAASAYENSCLNNIFDFTATFVYTENPDNSYKVKHSLTVLFYQWYTPGDITISPTIITKTRKNFCDWVERRKNSFGKLDFYGGLSFKKMKNEVGLNYESDKKYLSGLTRC